MKSSVLSTVSDTVMSSLGIKSEMQQRWHQTLVKTKVPQMDIDDQLNIESRKKRKRNKQFWPEYTQKAYEESFEKQECCGDYTNKEKRMPDGIKISCKQREGVIALISELHKKKQYRKDTLFIAYSLLDRFLSRGKLESLPNGVLDLVQLGAVCLLMAAKLN